MYKRILTVQDISCLGQCSLTVALPILSAAGHETCIIPSAVLSTHTGGFSGFTFRDLSCDIPKIQQHWQKEGLSFDAIYTGYLGSEEQISHVCELFDTVLKPGGRRFVDPAMADNGRLYVGFNEDFVKEMKRLCARADVLVPNITEAAMLTGNEYREDYTKEYVEMLCRELTALGPKCVVLTGVSLDPGSTGVAVCEDGEMSYYFHRRLDVGCHGTGDVFASCLVGAQTRGKNLLEAAKIAASFTLKCIENTVGDKEHWYGVKFEPLLGELIDMLSRGI